MALQPWRKGTIVRIEDHTHNTKRFWIEIPEVDNFDFVPGQFVTLDLPIHEKPNKRWRSYSIASRPDGTNIFELLIVLAEHGLGTHYLFNDVGIGSELTFRGPQGVFVLPQPMEKPVLLICTGTGIAPFRSMATHIHTHGLPHKDMYLIFGCRTIKDLLYFDEMKMLQEQLPSFHYLPTLSREQWEGHQGYVHPIYEDLCNGKPDVNFFLCGWKQMIDEAKKRILDMGYDRKSDTPGALWLKDDRKKNNHSRTIAVDI